MKNSTKIVSLLLLNCLLVAALFIPGKRGALPPARSGDPSGSWGWSGIRALPPTRSGDATVSGIQPGTWLAILPVTDLPAKFTLSHQVWNGKNWLPAADETTVIERGSDPTTVIVNGIKQGTDSTTVVSGIKPGTPLVILPLSDLPAKPTLPAADAIKP